MAVELTDEQIAQRIAEQKAREDAAAASHAARAEADAQARATADALAAEDAAVCRDLTVALARCRTYNALGNPTPEDYAHAYGAVEAAQYRYSGLVFTGDPSSKARDLFMLVSAQVARAIAPKPVEP